VGRFSFFATEIPTNSNQSRAKINVSSKQVRAKLRAPTRPLGGGAAGPNEAPREGGKKSIFQKVEKIFIFDGFRATSKTSVSGICSN